MDMFTSGKRLWSAGLLLLLGCGTSENQTQEQIKLPESNYELFSFLSPEQTGVTFRNNVPDNEKVNILTYEYFYNGAGVSVGDINNDELPDLYFTGNMESNRLYLNKGDMEFEDITQSAGVNGSAGWATGTTMADVNADGWLDIYVCRSGKLKPENRKNELFINNGDGTFTEKAEEFGLASPAYSTQAVFLDYDRDNDLDMFLLNHSIQLFTGKHVMDLKMVKDPYSGDKLFRNDNGIFEEVTLESGIHTNPLGYGLGVAVGDLNNDGWPDIYVTNDYVEPDYMYINNGDGTFTDRIRERTAHISNFGMGVDFGDINNDGWQDIFVADMVAADNYRQKTNMRAMNPEEFYLAVDNGFHYQYMFNTLQLNRGVDFFSEIGQLAGISNTDWSWTTLLVDLDNDMWKDIMVTNGFRKEFSNKDFVKFRNKIQKKYGDADEKSRLSAMRLLLDSLPEQKIGNYVFRNNRDLSFKDVSDLWDFNQPSHSNGAAYGDLDLDGDLDVVVSNIDSVPFIYQNLTRENNGGNFLRVKLDGPDRNPFGTGAKVVVYTGDTKQTQEQYTTRGYQSSVPSTLHFGLGGYSSADSIIVIWGNGYYEKFTDIKANQTLDIQYAEQDLKEIPRQQRPVFLDFTSRFPVEYRHIENDFYDFTREVLLPHKMSNFGPALAVGDLDGNGLEDLVLGGAAGYPTMIRLQKEQNQFETLFSEVIAGDSICEDVGAAVFDANLDGLPDIYMVSGGNEFDPDSPELQDRLYLNKGNGSFERSDGLPKMLSSGSVVKPFDYDQDGDLDLFVGGRVVPGRYPEPPRSFLLKNNGGIFTDVTLENAPELEYPGLVTDALWTDFNSDGKKDLIVVGEWMHIMMMENEGGNFRNISKENGMDQETGWWFTVNEGDFNNDGRPDYFAGNLGRNYKYKASHSEPFQVFSNDFDENGTLDIVLGYFNEGELFPLRGRQCSSEQMPFITEKFKSYHDFGTASLEQVYGAEALEISLNYKARNFSSSLIINQGEGQFDVVPIPNIGQISNVNSSIIEDFNADGNADLLIAGNLYPVEIETIRNDASIGMLFWGDGNGGLLPVDPAESGIKLNLDVRHIQPIRLGQFRGYVVASNQAKLRILIPDPNSTPGKQTAERRP